MASLENQTMLLDIQMPSCVEKSNLSMEVVLGIYFRCWSKQKGATLNPEIDREKSNKNQTS